MSRKSIAWGVVGLCVGVGLGWLVAGVDVPSGPPQADDSPDEPALRFAEERPSGMQCEILPLGYGGLDDIGLILTGHATGGQAVKEERYTFTSESDFDAALARSEADSDIWIDRTVQFGRQGLDDTAFWALNTWERVPQ